MVMFAFEFAVLTVLSLSTTARYALSLYEAIVIKRQIAFGRERLRQRPETRLSEEEINNTEIDAAGWEERGLWIFYLDIATDFFKLVLYLSFFCVLCVFYGMPIHIIRDVALTIRSFYKRIRDFVQYKHATRDMNARYPDATAEEILREDVCIICRENMTAWPDSTTHQGMEATHPDNQPLDERQRAKRLPCGHLLHFACLRSWLERQQICPTCRTPVIRNAPEPPNPNQAAGPAVQGEPRAINPPAGGPHTYTFGPFRLVFGARPVNQDGQLNPLAAGDARNPTEAILTRNSPTLSSVGVQAQLNQIEQHIAREISTLNHMSDQLQLLRALQSELARLRISQGVPGNLAPGSNYQYRQMSYPPPQQILQAYRQVPLGQGTQDFPAGLTIPENWTLHALHRIPGNTNVGTQTGHGGEGPPQQVQSVDAQPQGSDLALNRGSSNGPAEVSGTEYNTSSVEDKDSEAPALDPTYPSERIQPGRASADENSISIPEWGSAILHGRERDEQSRRESSQRKGKGKAVTVEDDADDMVG
ncbi:MAG: hypothetical protein Q9225_000696 [Loekoesia sp. 1 TL-2023]